MPKKTKTGRIPQCTPEITEVICERIAGNYSKESAAIFAGISSRTMYAWLAKGRGEKPKPVYKQFLQGVEKALAESKARSIATIERARDTTHKKHVKKVVQTRELIIKGVSATEITTTETHDVIEVANWQPAAWLLERRFPDEFGRRDRRDEEDESDTGPRLIKRGMPGPGEAPKKDD